MLTLGKRAGIERFYHKVIWWFGDSVSIYVAIENSNGILILIETIINQHDYCLFRIKP